MEEYKPSAIEKKWQKKWEKDEAFKAVDFSDAPKKYILVEFPYPSGDGLHVGHCRSYTALDIVARKSRMEGANVLFPMGWDAFGLPTENYAIKTGIHPEEATKKNTDIFRRQLKSLGFSFDWSREINTTDPGYYKWTQWIFLQLYKEGLAYKQKIPINWCPSCKIGLANEEVVEGKCERCGTEVEQREMEQWMLKITDYADKLLAGLDEVDYPQRVKDQQRNWIGRKEGIDISYPVVEIEEEIICFTTRPDTNFGATFIVLAPEHELVQKIVSGEIETDGGATRKEIAEYVQHAMHKSELQRQEDGKDKTGINTGLKAINRLNDEEIPIWVSDFVLGGFGTGAVAAVPGHDVRDFEFADKFGLPVRRVVAAGDGDASEITKTEQVQEKEGTMINSEFLDGLDIHEAAQKMMDYLEEKDWGKRTISWRLKDWVFSRQHYWGEPIPIIYCDECGVVPVPEEDLPVELPQVEEYEPTDTGESPLANVDEWVNTTCPECSGRAKRETDTMPNWAGSSWYYLRYVDPQNDETLAGEKLMKYWTPVDIYNGGMEHTTLHLLYSRFWHKFLFDQGLVAENEPYARRTSHGMVLGEGGIKMSKSKGNVVNPDDVVEEFGADTLRVYEMFMGPFENMVEWNTFSMNGVKRFFDRTWKLQSKIGGEDVEVAGDLNLVVQRTIKRVTDGIDQFKFNTAVAALMEMLNELEKLERVPLEAWKTFMQLISPFAPHITEELWQKINKDGSVFGGGWPNYDESLLASVEVTVPVQVNGKVRGEIKAAPDAEQEGVEKAAGEIDNVKKYLLGGAKVKVIYVPGRMINFVILDK